MSHTAEVDHDNRAERTRRNLLAGAAVAAGGAAAVSLASPGKALAANSGDYVSVTDVAYGAKGDGSTDDSKAIQMAIDAASSAGGGTVYLPTGTYIVSTTLKLKSNVHLIGAGVEAATLKLKNSANTDILTTANYGSNGIADASIRDVFFDGNSANNSSGTGIKTDGISLLVENLIVLNCATDGIDHTQSKEPNESRALGEDDSLWSNVRVLDSERYGIRVNAHDNHFVNVWCCSNETVNFLVDEEGYAAKLTQVHCFGASDYGFQFKASAKCVNCEAEGGREANVLLSGDNVQWIGGSVFQDKGIPAGLVGFEFESGAGFGTYITGTRINDCTTAALKFGSSGANSRIAAAIVAEKGSVVTGSPSGSVDFDLTVSGGITDNRVAPTVASANTISPPNRVPLVLISGTTEIKKITATSAGHLLVLKFSSSLTVKEGENLKLRGETDEHEEEIDSFKASPESRLTLVCDGTSWFEVARVKVSYP